jgi:[acyl-carrier-protein] S-malonyltransferase
MKLGMVFPGQGSQSIAMMRPFGDVRVVRETFGEASDVLGQDLWRLAADGPAQELNATVNTQPVMLTAGYAVYRAWCEAGGLEPAVVAGHSLGEYTALVAAGAIAFRDAVPLVRFRAQAMQEAVPLGTGAMAAILGLDAAAVRAACMEAARGEVVEAVNFNAPNQVVIAGHKAAVERAAEAAKGRGARRAVMLQVSAPFHSTLLRPAAEQLARRLAGVAIVRPAVPVVNNVDVATEDDPVRIKEALARQACYPVRWVEVIQHMAAAGVTHLAECGPGKVLAGLTRRIVTGMQTYAFTDPQSMQQALQVLR